MSVCIIPARGGSQRIPRKNIKVFHGQPIIAYSIHAAQESGVFDRVIVSTDDHDIAEVATHYSADIHWRKADMCRDEIGTQAVMANALVDKECELDRVSACLYPCAPMVTSEILREAIRLTYSGYVVGSYEDRVEDCGALYCGHGYRFVNDWPLVDTTTIVLPIPGAVDINTPNDWERAEKLWKEMHG